MIGKKSRDNINVFINSIINRLGKFVTYHKKNSLPREHDDIKLA